MDLAVELVATPFDLQLKFVGRWRKFTEHDESLLTGSADNGTGYRTVSGYLDPCVIDHSATPKPGARRSPDTLGHLFVLRYATVTLKYIPPKSIGH
jgi:hypothetical protein